MLEMSDLALSVVRSSYTMRIRAESWLDGELLADDIPVSTGSEDWDDSLSVPERVSLTVPSVDGGFSWEPISPTHPLSAYGQQLRISIGIDVGRGVTEWIDRGWFLITDSDGDGKTVSVEAEGLLKLIEEARFVAPFQPDGTFVSTVQDLVEPAIPVEIDDSLTDRAIPGSLQWDEERLDALLEVFDTWPAEGRVNADGVLYVTVPSEETSEPVWHFHEDDEGTVVQWSGKTARDNSYNVVVAQGEIPDESEEGGEAEQIQGVAYDLDSLSPLRIGGPFNPLPVPYKSFSPLLTTVEQCRKSAQTTLARLRRQVARIIEVTAVPHPGLERGDVVSVTSRQLGLKEARAVIDKGTLPYSPGEMRLTLRLV